MISDIPNFSCVFQKMLNISSKHSFKVNQIKKKAQA